MGVAAPADATMRPLYPAGNVSISFGYNYTLHAYTYKCVFNGWVSGPTKYWYCELVQDVPPYATLSEHDGSWVRSLAWFGRELRLE